MRLGFPVPCAFTLMMKIILHLLLSVFSCRRISITRTETTSVLFAVLSPEPGIVSFPQE
jgi:hypothetical protein